MYLIKRRKTPGKKWVAHIWHGNYPKSLEGDTACRMWSTGGMAQEKYFITPTPLHIAPTGRKTELKVCHMCGINEAKK